MNELFYFLHGTPAEATEFLTDFNSAAKDKETQFWVEEELSAEEAKAQWASEIEDASHRVFLIHADVTDRDFKLLELEDEWSER
jgi:hypothetical protein